MGTLAVNLKLWFRPFSTFTLPHNMTANDGWNSYYQFPRTNIEVQ